MTAEDELLELRQAIWDAYGILGGDRDGDTDHRAFTPNNGWAEFLRRFAREARAERDELIDEINFL